MNIFSKVVFTISLVFTLQLFSFPTKEKILLTDVELQFQITEAMNNLYNFKFEKADSAFIELKNKYPKHPLPYFLLGYSQYWRTMPNEVNTSNDPKFYAYMDTVINLADDIYDRDDKNFEAVFFLTAAHGFNGRRRSDNKEWATATYEGGRALKFLKEGREFNDLSPEFLFGEGLFNYFAEWIPENYKGLKPVMWFFPKGDKQKGIEYLKKSTQNSFYTRIEAMHYLMRIYLFEEQKDTAALPLAKYLHQTYPDNPVFHRMYARVLFSTGHGTECERVSNDIALKHQNKYPGYEENTARYASFYLGYANRFRNKDKAKKYFLKNVEFSEKIGAVKMNYYLYSLEALADIAVEEFEFENAKMYYRKIEQNTGRKSEMRKRTRKKLKSLEND